MTNSDIDSKFNKIVSSKDIAELESVIILQTGKDSYDLFSKFKIIKKSKNEILVTSKDGDLINIFCSMRAAISWCIFERRGKYMTSSRILQIDRILSGIDIIIKMSEKLFKKANTVEGKLIHLAKLNEEKLKKTYLQTELEDYVNQSNYWQQSQFKLKTE